ncbi:kinase-like protein [Rhizophagus irregularis]|uniref:Kinase-like protein n=1 Tax=Rhizophagus irregularis TaxID=588596 RepID=A0A2N0NX90_9GLOM|nr:kinase-like protein [Rhizophagus irregularis]
MDPKTKDYMLVLQYAKENLHEYLQTNYVKITWKEKVEMLYQISIGVKRIHDADYTHGDLHSGNILHQENPNNKNYQITDLGRAQPEDNPSNEIYGILLSLWNTNRDIGLCVNETKVYGVMPYIAPEVLRGKKYTQAADIYSLGMLMYFIATGKQPFYDWPHDQVLAIWVCEGHRPKINEPEAPKCYIDLMKRCWDLNPDNRPKINEIIELAGLFNDSEQQQHNEIGRQLNEAEEYRKENPLSIDVIQSNTHSQAIYTSRLLDIDNNSVEIIDLTESTDQKYE